MFALLCSAAALLCWCCAVLCLREGVFYVHAVPDVLGSVEIQVFFRGEDEFDQLVRISRVLGTDDLYAYAEKYGVEMDPKLVQLCGYR